MPERDAQGRFLKGNPGGPGNPLGQHVARLRKALLEAVTPEDMKEVAAALLAAAKLGDVAAAKELLLRCLGRPLESDLLERLEQLEAAYAGGTEGNPGGCKMSSPPGRSRHGGYTHGGSATGQPSVVSLGRGLPVALSGGRVRIVPLRVFGDPEGAGDPPSPGPGVGTSRTGTPNRDTTGNRYT